MRRINCFIAAALLACAAAAAPASAKVRSRVITVGQSFLVGATVVEAGTYRFSFDDEKNEMTVSDRKTKQVVARAAARAERKKGSYPALLLEARDGGPLAFAGLSFDGKQVVTADAAAALSK